MIVDQPYMGQLAKRQRWQVIKIWFLSFIERYHVQRCLIFILWKMSGTERFHVQAFAPHGIRHNAVQLLLWTFYLESEPNKGWEQPVRLRFDKPGGNPELFQRATEWTGDIAISDAEFQKNAQEMIDCHLKTEQPVHKPSEYNSAILQQIMMRYPEVKDKCPFATDVVEKQCKVIGQLTTCIIW